MGSFENNVYHGQHLFLVGRKMKGMDRKTISLLGLVGKNLREEKTNGGNCFPLGLTFFLSPKLEGKMRVMHKATIFLSLSLLTKQLALISLFLSVFGCRREEEKKRENYTSLSFVWFVKGR